MPNSNFLPWLKTKVPAGEWYPLPTTAHPQMLEFVNDLLLQKEHDETAGSFKLNVRDDGSIDLDFLGSEMRLRLSKNAAPIVDARTAALRYRAIKIDDVGAIAFRWHRDDLR